MQGHDKSPVGSRCWRSGSDRDPGEASNPNAGVSVYPAPPGDREITRRPRHSSQFCRAMGTGAHPSVHASLEQISAAAIRTDHSCWPVGGQQEGNEHFSATGSRAPLPVVHPTCAPRSGASKIQNIGSGLLIHIASKVSIRAHWRGVTAPSEMIDQGRCGSEVVQGPLPRRACSAGEAGCGTGLLLGHERAAWRV